MEMENYIVSEFTGTALAIRKHLGKEFSVKELRDFTEELRDIAEIKTLYVSNSRDKHSIQTLICKFKNEQAFTGFITKLLPASYRASTSNAFHISGFKYNDNEDTCTLYFTSMQLNGFTDAEMLAFASQMFELGAESVVNRRHDGKSNLLYRLHLFEIMEKHNFVDPIRELSCTFKNTPTGQEIVKELFKNYASAPNLAVDCYPNCIIGKYTDTSTCTLVKTSHRDFFGAETLAKICYWLHTLGAKSVIPSIYEYCGRIGNPSIECSFDYDDQNFEVKLDDLIQYWNGRIVTDNDGKEYSPELHLTLSTKKNSFKVFKDDKQDEKFTHSERAYLLNKFLQLGAESVTAEASFIVCSFKDSEIGHTLRAEAVFKLLTT